MHLFFITRGIKQDVDRMIMNLESLYLPWKATAPDGKEIGAIQCNLQPIQLWSLVLPKEHMDPMLRTLKPTTTLGFEGAPMQAPSRKLSLAMLRKGLGLKPVPKWEPEGKAFPIWTKNMQILGLGIKEDYTAKEGHEAL